MCHFAFVEALKLFISNRSINVIHRENVGKIKLLPLFISVCNFKSSFRDFTKWNPFETSIRVWKGFNQVSKGEYFFEKNFHGISRSFICCFIWGESTFWQLKWKRCTFSTSYKLNELLPCLSISKNGNSNKLLIPIFAFFLANMRRNNNCFMLFKNTHSDT